MIHCDSIFNLSSGVTCNWCIQMDAPQSLALRQHLQIICKHVLGYMSNCQMMASFNLFFIVFIYKFVLLT